MTLNETKKRLSKYRVLKRELLQIRQELVVLETEMYAPKGPSLNGMPGSIGDDSVLINRIAAKKELLTLYEQWYTEMLQVQKEIELLIDGLESIERQICRYRYLDGLRWEKICGKMNYSWAQVHRYHSKALRKIAAMIEQDDTQ